MENTQIQTMLDSAAQQTQAAQPQPQADDIELRLRARELITQARTIQEITRDLAYTMAMTASCDLDHIEPTIVRPAGFHW